MVIQKIFFDIVAPLFFIKIKSNRKITLSVREAFPRRKRFSSSSLEKYYEAAKYFSNLHSDSKQTTANELKKSHSVEETKSLSKSKYKNSKTNDDDNDDFEKTPPVKYISQRYLQKNPDILIANSKNSKSLPNRGFNSLFNNECDTCQNTPEYSSNKLLLRASPLLHKSSNNLNQINKQNNVFDLNNNSNNLDNISSATNTETNTENQNQELENRSSVSLSICNKPKIYRNKNNQNDILIKSANTFTNLSTRGQLGSQTNSCSCNNQIETLNDQRLNKVLKCLCQSAEKSELKEIIDEYKLEIKKQWTELANIIDVVMGFLFIVSTLLIYVYIFGQVPNLKLY